jgi:hypothetical protein
VSALISCDEELRVHPDVALIEETLRGRGQFEFDQNLPFLRRLAVSGLPRAALKIALRKAAAQPDYQLPKFVMEGPLKGWTFLVTDHFAMSIGIRNPEPDAPVPIPSIPPNDAPVPKLQPYPFDLMFGILHAGTVDMQHYTVRPAPSLSEDPSLCFVRNLKLSTGDSLFIRAGSDLTISHIKGTLVYLEITGPLTQRVLPQFDAVTLQPCGWISGDPTASRLELLTRTLVELEHSDGLPEVLALTWHEDHYVRWNSIRHLLCLSLESGMPRLYQACDDSHPDVREAARATLAALARPSKNSSGALPVGQPCR